MTDRSVALPLRIRKFLAKPVRQKLETVSFLLGSFFRAKPSSITLPFGAKWMLENSALDAQLRSGEFEKAETSFVQQFLRPRMTVLDIGAHHGFYTLLASTRVGKEGKVIAFEPSPRERARLERHVRLNKCHNVQIEPFALACANEQVDLFLVEGLEDYCNSLRPPAVQATTRTVKVEATSLDEFLSRAGIRAVDFIKLDVEGAELDVLRGARKLLQTGPRPVLMVEVYDIRTEPWGYRAHEIVQLLDRADYQWYELLKNGTPKPVEPNEDSYDANLIAAPRENMKTLVDSFRASNG